MLNRGHTAECRKRIEEELRKNEDMKKDVEKAVQRMNEYIARQVEENIKAQQRSARTEAIDSEV